MTTWLHIYPYYHLDESLHQTLATLNTSTDFCCALQSYIKSLVCDSHSAFFFFYNSKWGQTVSDISAVLSKVHFSMSEILLSAVK